MSEQDRNRPEPKKGFADAGLPEEVNREEDLPIEGGPAREEVLPPIAGSLNGEATADKKAEEPALPDGNLAPHEEGVPESAREIMPDGTVDFQQTVVEGQKELLPPGDVPQAHEAGDEEQPKTNPEEEPVVNEQTATEEDTEQVSPEETVAPTVEQNEETVSPQIPEALPGGAAIGGAVAGGVDSALVAPAAPAEEHLDEHDAVEDAHEEMPPVVANEEKPGVEPEQSEPLVPWDEKEAYEDFPERQETGDSTSAGISTEPAGVEMPAAESVQETVDVNEASISHDDGASIREDAESASVTEPAGSALAGLDDITNPDETAGAEEIEVKEEVVDDLAHIIEAIIFASDEPLPVSTIRSVLDAAHTFGRVNSDMITSRIAALNAKYESEGSGFCIVEIANGYQYATRKEMAQWVSNLFKERSKRRLSNSALETLAIIAYKQPITKPEIESIRGVNVDYVLHNLLEKELVTVVGRAETVGRPLLYGTTQKFMKVFTLKNLDDLPKLREIEEIIKEIRSKGAEESIQLEITALGDSSAPEPAMPENKPEVSSENGTE